MSAEGPMGWWSVGCSGGLVVTQGALTTCLMAVRRTESAAICRAVPISGQQQQQQQQQQHQQLVQQQLLAQQQQQLQIQQLQQQLLLQRLERELQQSYSCLRQRWLTDYAAPHQQHQQIAQQQQLLAAQQLQLQHQQLQHQQQQQQQQQQQYSYYFSRGSTNTDLGLGLGLGFGLGSGNLASWYHLPSTSAHIYIGTTSSGGAPGSAPYPPYPYRSVGGYSGGGYPAAALINFDASPTPLLASAGTSPGYLPPLAIPAALPPPPPAPSVATDYYFSSRSTRTVPPPVPPTPAAVAAAASASAVSTSPFREYGSAAEELQAGYRYKATPRRRYDAYDNYGYLPGFASTTEDEEDLLEECLPQELLSTDCSSLEELRFFHLQEEDEDEDDEEVATQLAHILDLPDFLHPYGGSGRDSLHSHKTPPQHEYQTEHGSAAAGGAGSAGSDGRGGGGGQSQRVLEDQRYQPYQYQQQQQQQHHQQQQQLHQQHQSHFPQQHQHFQPSQQQLQQQSYHSYQYPSQDSCEGFNQFATNAGSCLGNQRMMVSKLWNSCFPEFTPDHVHRHNFYLCQWQRNTQVRIVYLFYRWITAITCLAALVCSLLDIGRTDEHFEHHYAKWWIYLTHWGLLFCTVQAWLAAWIVTQGMMVEREDFEIVRQAKKSRLHHLYWVLYTCATVYAFIVTMCYWLLVHNPGK
ncbi:GD22071 [Drosophila simulans]|uniref:GD22071 n=1 Tax=Drosophila simulans TaxID=7240 RepID=B4Q4R6_DROSI|nr:GD22071 [Drosophila simulans]